MAPSLARTMPRANSGKAVQRVGGYRTSPLGAQVSRVGPRAWPRPWGRTGEMREVFRPKKMGRGPATLFRSYLS